MGKIERIVRSLRVAPPLPVAPRNTTSTADDALGRPVHVVDAYVPTVNNGLPTDSNNQTTTYAYDGLGQTTAFGVTTAGGSGVNSNDLLATEQYPDPATGLPSTSANNQIGFSCLCGVPWADRSSVHVHPQCLVGPSPPSDDLTSSA